MGHAPAAGHPLRRGRRLGPLRDPRDARHAPVPARALDARRAQRDHRRRRRRVRRLRRQPAVGRLPPPRHGLLRRGHQRRRRHARRGLLAAAGRRRAEGRDRRHGDRRADRPAARRRAGRARGPRDLPGLPGVPRRRHAGDGSYRIDGVTAASYPKLSFQRAGYDTVTAPDVTVAENRRRAATPRCSATGRP